MEFVFVVGGSYKAFCLNHLHNIGTPDLIIFNQNIFYDFDVEVEGNFNGPVSSELIYLNNLFNCPIVVYGSKVVKGEKHKCFIICSHRKIKIFEQHRDIYLRVENNYILIGSNQYFRSKTFATITISDNEQSLKLKQSEVNNYFQLNKKSITLNRGNKFCKKFNKCCKFIL